MTAAGLAAALADAAECDDAEAAVFLPAFLKWAVESGALRALNN